MSTHVRSSISLINKFINTMVCPPVREKISNFNNSIHIYTSVDRSHNELVLKLVRGEYI